MSTTQEDSAERDPGNENVVSEPAAPALPGPPRRGKRGPRWRWIIISGALILLVVLGANIARFLPTNKPVAPRPLPLGSTFITLPLSPAQISQLQHMPERMQVQQLANIYVSHMNLDEKLGQLFMVQAQTWNDSANTPDTLYMLNNLYAGGIIMYTIQMHTLAQAKSDIANMQAHASIPLLVSADEEGGEVERVQNIFGDRPGAMQTYETGNIQSATKLGDGIARDLQEVGINTDLAPDVDVLQADNSSSYMDTRTFGTTPQSVITYGGADLRAVQGDGEIGCLKHYPGLGAAKTDAHYSLPVINSSKDKIYSTDLAPYQALISSSNPLDHPGMIMTTDLMMPALDSKLPAELSPTIITDILRNQLHYNGVVITDALWMDGIAQKWNLVQASIMALQAGDDMLLGAIGSAQMEMVLNGLKAALQDGQLSMNRINQAVTRIIALKFQYHILQTPWY
jgi:beta-N-acetylhexosaminidase